MTIGIRESTFVKSNTKFGRKISSVTSFSLLSEHDVVLPFFPGSAQPFFVAAAGATDTASGTGARQVTLLGCGSGFIEQTEDVWLDATSQVTTTLDWLRIDRMFVTLAGSNELNASDIWCGLGGWTAGVPDDKISHIFSGDGQTQEMKWTVPVSHEAHVHLMLFTSGKAVGLDVVSTFRLRTRSADRPDRPWRTRYETDAFDGQVGMETGLDAYIFPGPMDLIVDAQGSAAGSRQTALVAYELHKKLQA